MSKSTRKARAKAARPGTVASDPEIIDTSAEIGLSGTCAELTLVVMEEIRQRVDRITAQRDSLISGTIEAYQRLGIPAGFVQAPHRDPLNVGEKVYFWTFYSVLVGDMGHRWSRDARIPRGPRWRDGYVYVGHGAATVELVDGFNALVVAADPEPSEAEHRSAIVRLRRYADSEGFRIHTRDRAVTVVDAATKGVLHEGSVTSAALFLHGIGDEWVTEHAA